MPHGGGPAGWAEQTPNCARNALAWTSTSGSVPASGVNQGTRGKLCGCRLAPSLADLHNHYALRVMCFLAERHQPSIADPNEDHAGLPSHPAARHGGRERLRPPADAGFYANVCPGACLSRAPLGGARGQRCFQGAHSLAPMVPCGRT